jgi:hypothetical protein
MYSGRNRIIEAPYTGARIREVAMRRADWRRPPAYDHGGMLQPGLNLALNATRRPEPVLTHTQWHDLATAASHSGSVEYHAHFDGASTRALQREVRTASHAMSGSQAVRERGRAPALRCITGAMAM